MSLAENPLAVIGHNNPQPDEGEPQTVDTALPPKSQRLITVEEANAVLTCAKMLSARLKVAKKEILEKRKGGDIGRGIRRSLIYYLHGRGYHVWKIAAIVEINRKQIGEELVRFMAELVQYPALAKRHEQLERMLDAALEVEAQEFLDWLQAAIDDEKAEREEQKRQALEPKRDPRPTPKPKPRAVSAEVINLQAEVAARRRIAYLDQQIAIHLSVMRKALEPSASRDTQKNAKDAAKAMEPLILERKKLRAQLKPAKAKAKLS